MHIQSSAYSADVIAVSVGAAATWTNDVSAGRFPYHCKFHSSMHGRVDVWMLADGSATEGWKLRWATERATEGVAYDVQYKRSDATTWTDLRTNTRAATGKLDLAEPGEYVVRARTSNTKAGEESGWSPKVTLTIS